MECGSFGVLRKVLLPGLGPMVPPSFVILNYGGQLGTEARQPR